MTIFIVGWVLIVAYLVANHTFLTRVSLALQFIWVEVALLSVTAGAIWMLYTR